MKKSFLIVLSLVLVFLSACGSAAGPTGPQTQQTEVTTTPREETTAPSQDNEAPSGILSRFSATDLEGNPVDETALADYPLTMVNVWATFCGPCLMEMPDLGELAEEYQGQGVQIVGMVTDVLNSDGSLSDQQVSTAKDIVAQTGADYLHILPSQDLFGLLSQIVSVPTTFFVDQDGKQVGEVYIGARTKDAWKTILDQTLAEVS